MDNKLRIVKGLAYFRNIKPSEANASHWFHLNVFFDLVEKEVFGEKINPAPKEKTQEEIAEEVFGKESAV